MGSLLITGLALGLVVSVAGMLYPFWPFGRRWRATLAAALVFTTYAVAASGSGVAATQSDERLASATGSEIADPAGSTR